VLTQSLRQNSPFQSRSLTGVLTKAFDPPPQKPKPLATSPTPPSATSSEWANAPVPKLEQNTPWPCLENHRHFTPFVLSVDGLLRQEAKTFAEGFAVKLAGKWQKPCSQACGHVKARLRTAAVRAVHLCLHGSRVPAHQISTQFSQWEDGAGLAMHEWS